MKTSTPIQPKRPMSRGLLPTLMTGKHVGEKDIVHERVRQLVVEAAEPVLSHLDGELQAPQQRFEISLLPGALRLL